MRTLLQLRMWQYKKDMRMFIVMTILTLALSFVMGQSQNGRLPEIVVLDERGDVSTVLKADGRFDVSVLESSDGFGREKAVQRVEEGWISAFIEVQNEGILKVITTEQGVARFSLEQTITQAIEALQKKDETIQRVEKAIVEGEKSDRYSDGMNRQALHVRLEKNYEMLVEAGSPYKVEVLEVHKGIMGSGTTQRNVFLGILLLFASHTVVFGVGDILSDKELHVLQRLLVSGIPRWKLMLSYVLVSWFFGMSQSLILILGGRWIFGFDYPVSIGSIAVLCLFILSMASLGLFIAAFSRKHSQMSVVSSIVLTPAAMLGGCLWPLDIVQNKLLLSLSWFTPHRYAMSGLLRTAEGGFGNMVLVDMSMLLLMACVMGLSGAWLLGNRMEQMS